MSWHHFLFEFYKCNIPNLSTIIQMAADLEGKVHITSNTSQKDKVLQTNKKILALFT